MIDMVVDTAQILRLKNKMDKYPIYAIGGALEYTSEYLNSPSFKASMYPPSQSGQPFIWSNDRQRRKVFAMGLPSTRTMNLATSGNFKVEKKLGVSVIYYENLASYFKYVAGNFSQIIGHITRGWKPAGYHVSNQKFTILNRFRDFVIGAWNKL